eukprot:PhM_4_TR17732/c0_g1_i1/m.51136/K03660/OGG1; N-glycosylase/DNA lyase
MVKKLLQWRSLGTFPFAEFDLKSTLSSAQAHHWVARATEVPAAEGKLSRRKNDVSSSSSEYQHPIWSGVIHNDVFYLKQIETGRSQRVLSDIQFACTTLKYDNGKNDVKEEWSRADAVLRDYFQLDKSLEERCALWAAPPKAAQKKHRKGTERDVTVLNDLFSESLGACGNGLRLLRQPPHACLLAFICSQNNNVKRIASMVLTLCRSFGTKLDDDHYAFPSPDQILQRASEDKLRALGFGYRARYIMDAAKWLATNDINLLRKEFVPNLDEARKQLMGINGVGRKVADCVLLFSLDHADVVPVDTHVQQIANRHLGLEGTLTPARHESVRQDFLRAFGEECGWAHCVLFYAKLIRAVQHDEDVEDGDTDKAEPKRKKRK